jgi:50S ribosomal protein L16 3-hydroxylase
MPINLDAPLPLLGGLSPQTFMRRHWQRKPLLVRGGASAWIDQVPRSTLFDLARRDDVESRLVAQEAKGWTMKSGPFDRLPPVKRPAWTLLVQGVEAQLPAARSLMDAFRFIPEARLDDVMVSWASEGGGVGPHFDAYDVFLVQVAGQRRWRIGRQKDLSLRDDVPLKILQRFEPEEEWVLEPGDWLYLPPRWAHDGVAEGCDCITASVGFRAPSMLELADQLLPRLLDPDDEEPADLMKRYQDAGLQATNTPAQVPDELLAFAQLALARAVNDPQRLARALGEWLSEPKAQQVFSPKSGDAQYGIELAPASRMLVDRWHVFFNGDAFRASGKDAALMARLAHARRLEKADLTRLSADARALVDDWLEWGWLWPIEM